MNINQTYMKKTSFILILLLVVIYVSAQRYSINKLNFDSHQYIPEYGDIYNPGVSGVCSFLIPGLGQMLSGEPGRGLAFFGGYMGCAIVFEVGVVQIFNNFNDYEDPGYYGNSGKGVGTMLLGLGGMAFVSIWSIVDAIKVAKVNNMYYQSLRKTSSLNIQMTPYFDHLTITNQITNQVGMTMRVTF